MAITISGTDGIVGAGFTVDNSGVSVTAGVGTFSSVRGTHHGDGANLTSLPAAQLTGTLPALNAASLTSVPAANIVGLATAGFERSGGFPNTFVKLSKTTITSNTSQVDFTDSITGAFDTYKTYAVTITGLVPQSDDYTLRARKFDSNGIYSSSEQQTKVVENGSGYNYGGESSFVLIRQGIGNNSSGDLVYENFNGIFYFFNFAANNRFSVMSSCVYKNASSDAIFTTMGGTTNVTTATTGIRFYMSSGDISTGEFTLYGIAT